MSFARVSYGWTAVAVAACAAAASGQRVQFPSMVSNGGTPGATVAPTTPPPATPPPTLLPGQSAPPATFGGTVQPVPSWDPYSSSTSPSPGAVPSYTPPPVGAAGQPPALFPDGFSGGSGAGGYAYTQPAFQVSSVRRFMQELRFEYTWLPSNGGEKKFGISGIELSGTFSCPLFGNPDTPLLFTPGMAVWFLSGPVTTVSNQADMPPRLYDAYLDMAWQPRVTPWLSGDLGLRAGVYSDFSYADSRSVRLMGRGLGVVTLTPTMQVSLGIVYLDRNDIKMLPAGGVIWTPNPNRRWEIVFPNPKLANRMRDIGTTEWWWYVSGEYGGGAWTVTRSDDVLGTWPEDPKDSVDYNDIRVILGTEWTTLGGMNGFVEIGYVFQREIVYVSRVPVNFNPENTLMLRAGVAF